jgi:hypothetical protein
VHGRCIPLLLGLMACDSFGSVGADAGSEADGGPAAPDAAPEPAEASTPRATQCPGGCDRSRCCCIVENTPSTCALAANCTVVLKGTCE